MTTMASAAYSAFVSENTGAEAAHTATSIAITVAPTGSELLRAMIWPMVSEPPVLAPQRNTRP